MNGKKEHLRASGHMESKDLLGQSAVQSNAIDTNVGTQPADTIVVLHDSCYGHRYSRPKTSKSALGLIMERPERLQAAMLGVAIAYVRLADDAMLEDCPRHESQYLVDSAHKKPFVIKKTTRSVALTSSVITNVHGMKWMQELSWMCNSAEARLAAHGKELDRHDPLKAPLHEGDLYLCKDSLNAFQGAIGAVLDGVDAVFHEPKQHKKAFVCVRPPGHHCSTDYPSGFCWVNNVHIGIEHAAQTYGLTHAAIIDFDLHHGDGSQAIAWDRNTRAEEMPKNTSFKKRTSIGYFSLHDINSYPCEYGDDEKVRNASVCIDGAHGQHIWNTHLQPWKTEAEFWNLYDTQYVVLLEKARLFLHKHTERIQMSTESAQPKAAIFISAGFDASEWESEGMQRHKLNVPSEFYARFTADVVKLSEEIDTAVEGRVVSVLEGGYSDRALTSGVLSHLTGLVQGAQSLTNFNTKESTEPTTVGEHVGSLEHEHMYQTSWWTAAALAAVENMAYPLKGVPGKKPRSRSPPTYTAPTESFTAKVIENSKQHRSTSRNIPDAPKSRPTTPPLPSSPRDWATSASQLCKSLIPEDCRISSCTSEELSQPRVKRDRHSSIGLPSTIPPGDRMQLRRRSGIAASLVDSNKLYASTVTQPLQTRAPALSRNKSSGLQDNKTRKSNGRRASLATSTTNIQVPSLPEISKQHGSHVNDSAMDSLTEGVEKITLKISQPAKKKTMVSGTNTTKSPKKPRVVKVSKSSNHNYSSIEAVNSPQLAKNPSQIPKDNPPIPADEWEKITTVESVQQKPHPVNMDIAAEPSSFAYIPCSLMDEHNYKPYVRDNVLPQAPTWSAPITSTPVLVPVTTGNKELPVFTADSYIPFAMSSRETEHTQGARVPQNPEVLDVMVDAS